MTRKTGSIIITPASAMLASIEETLLLEAVVYDSLGAAILGAPVVWSSNDPSIATVDADGRVTAVSNGTTQITATSGGVSASARIVVDQEAGSIIITPASAMLASIEETLQLEAVVYDSLGAAILGAPIVWSSNDPSVAAVAADGLVTAVSNGMTQITATSGGVSASARIVVDQEAGSIIITPASAMLTSVGEIVRLEAVVYDSLGAAILGAPVVWSSNDPSIATVDADGRVTAVSNGTTQITATSGGVSASARIVVDQEAGSIIITPASAMLTSVGEIVRLEAVVYDSLGAAILGAPVVWSSSDMSVATVSARGLVTAVGRGSTRITAMSGGVNDRAFITVTLPAARIEVEPSSTKLTSVGATEQLTATVYDANDDIIPSATVAWSSSDTSVATVSARGLVTAVGRGSTRITAMSGGVNDRAFITVTLPAARIARSTPSRATLISVGDDRAVDCDGLRRQRRYHTRRDGGVVEQ